MHANQSVTFTQELKRGKKEQCVSNRCKDLFERKKYFGARCTLNIKTAGINDCAVEKESSDLKFI